MSLNNNIHGLLENIIDESINILPPLINHIRDTIHPEFGIHKVEDFAFGFIQGLIMGQFINLYRSIYAQNPPSDISAEFERILLRRARDIRDEIFRAL